MAEIVGNPLTDKTATAAPLVDEDLFHGVDVSDTSQNPAGSSFKYTMLKLWTYILGKIGVTNGLTKNGSDVELGGTLTKDTELNNATFDLRVNGTRATALLKVTQSGSGRAVEATATTAAAVRGLNSNGTGVEGVVVGIGTGVVGSSTAGAGGSFSGIRGVDANSSTQPALVGTSTEGTPIVAVKAPANGNAVSALIDITRGTTGTAADGIGASIEINVETTGENLRKTHSIRSIWTEAADATRKCLFEVYTFGLEYVGRLFAFKGTGQLILDRYGSGAFTGIPTKNLAVTSTGDVIEVDGTPGGDDIPLTGTTSGNPVTGDIEIDSLTNGERSIYSGDLSGDYLKYFLDKDGSRIGIERKDSGVMSRVQLGTQNVLITLTDASASGIEGAADFSANYNPLSFVQKSYVDGLVATSGLPSGVAGQILQHNGTSWYSSTGLQNDGLGVIFNVNEGKILDISGGLSVYTQNRELNDSLNNVAIQWDQRYLKDSAGNNSADWNSRQLTDSANAVRVDWEAGYLTNVSGTTVIDFGTLITYDGTGQTSINWGSRELIRSDGSYAWNWEIEEVPLINHTIFTPTTGATVNVVKNQTNIIDPASALLALTINLPGSPTNNQFVDLKFTQQITTVTYTGGTIAGGLASPIAGSFTKLVFDSATNTWY